MNRPKQKQIGKNFKNIVNEVMEEAADELIETDKLIEEDAINKELFTEATRRHIKALKIAGDDMRGVYTYLSALYVAGAIDDEILCNVKEYIAELDAENYMCENCSCDGECEEAE